MSLSVLPIVNVEGLPVSQKSYDEQIDSFGRLHFIDSLEVHAVPKIEIVAAVALSLLNDISTRLVSSGDRILGGGLSRSLEGGYVKLSHRGLIDPKWIKDCSDPYIKCAGKIIDSTFIDLEFSYEI